MLPNDMIMIYYWDKRNGSHFGTYPVKNEPFRLETSKFLIFFIISASRTCNRFWDSFEWFCLQISSDAKYFSSLVRGIMIKDLYLYIIFSNLKQKKHNIIISSVIYNHMGSMYIETHYIRKKYLAAI